MTDPSSRSCLARSALLRFFFRSTVSLADNFFSVALAGGLFGDALRLAAFALGDALRVDVFALGDAALFCFCFGDDLLLGDAVRLAVFAVALGGFLGDAVRLAVFAVALGGFLGDALRVPGFAALAFGDVLGDEPRAATLAFGDFLGDEPRAATQACRNLWESVRVSLLSSRIVRSKTSRLPMVLFLLPPKNIPKQWSLGQYLHGQRWPRKSRGKNAWFNSAGCATPRYLHLAALVYKIVWALKR